MARGHSHGEEIGLGKDRTGSPEGKKPAKDANPPAPQRKSDQVSRVLRTVYDDTLREDVPAEFQDLLKKLK